MKFKTPQLLALFVLAALDIRAQEIAGLQTLQAGVKFRTDMALAVEKGDESAASGVARIRARNTTGGVVDHAGLGQAALDLGHRLLGAGRPAEAEVFFREAESALEQAVSKTTRAQPRERAEYLQKLAHLRVNFLNKAALAKANIDEAISLQPGDQDIKRTRAQLARGNAEIFKEIARK